MTSIDLLLVEDQRFLLTLLRETLDAVPEFRIVAACSSAEEADEVAAPYQVAITDIALPGANGFEWGLALKERRPQVGVLLLSSHAFPSLLAQLPVAHSGGWGYLLKSSIADVEELRRAVHIVADGGMVIDGALRKRARPAAGSPLERLTPGQWQLLRALAGGWSNQAISEQLGITPKSVENAVGRLYQQLDIDATDRDRNARVKATQLFLRHSEEMG
jgi:DNA-binding NarL/FixJ family response regulator